MKKIKIGERKLKINRRAWNDQGLALSGYLASHYVFSFIIVFAYVIIEAILNRDIEVGMNQFLESDRGMGLLSCVLTVLGIGVVWLWGKKRDMNLAIFEQRKAITLKEFLIFYCCIAIPQVLSAYSSAWIEEVLNYFGYTMNSDLEWMYGGSNSVEMLFYCILFGPIAEEIIFRGIILKNNEAYGKRFAIIFSSLLFGIFHANFIQGAFAFLIGIIFAYVAMEYSIKWAIVMHVVNNSVSEITCYLADNIESPIYGIIFTFLNIGMAIFALTMMLIKRKEIARYLEENKGEKGIWGRAVPAIGIVIYIVINVLSAMGNIAQLPA